MMRVLVTGVAGFIGAPAAERLLNRGEQVVGVDNSTTTKLLHEAGLPRTRCVPFRRQAHFLREDFSSFSRLCLAWRARGQSHRAGRRARPSPLLNRESARPRPVKSSRGTSICWSWPCSAVEHSLCQLLLGPRQQCNGAVLG